VQRLPVFDKDCDSRISYNLTAIPGFAATMLGSLHMQRRATCALGSSGGLVQGHCGIAAGSPWRLAGRRAAPASCRWAYHLVK
jgi:hypothetical protein